MDTLSDLAVFVRVAALGSFTAAADELEISRPAVSKYVGRLEDTLGARLFHRTTRKLTLTEPGEALYRRASPALQELDEARDEVARFNAAPRGVLRITAPVLLGVTVLAPMLKDFRARHPEVQIDLDLSDHLVDLVAERFDLALRISQLADSSLVARRLASCPQVICAAPAYLAKRGKPRSPAELRDHDCLIYGLDRVPHEWRLRMPNGRWVAVVVRGGFRSNNDLALKQALLDGFGIRQFPRFFVERELDDGRLVEVLPQYASPELAIYAVYAARRHLAPKVRAFVDFVSQRLDGAAIRAKEKPPISRGRS